MVNYEIDVIAINDGDIISVNTGDILVGMKSDATSLIILRKIAQR